MSKREWKTSRKQREPRCPVCSKSINDTMDIRAFHLPEVPPCPRADDWTICLNCRTRLEYRDGSTGLILRRMPQDRVNHLNRVMAETPREPSLAEIVQHVRAYRRMPPRSPARAKF
jgi:hypothetical protein